MVPPESSRWAAREPGARTSDSRQRPVDTVPPFGSLGTS